MDSKRCPKCDKVLPLSNFNKSKWYTKDGEKEGYKCYCRACMISYQREWRSKNPKAVKVYRERERQKRKRKYA